MVGVNSGRRTTLGHLRQASTIVNDRLHALSFHSEMSKSVEISPHPSVGKLWECGKTLGSLSFVACGSVGKKFGHSGCA